MASDDDVSDLEPAVPARDEFGRLSLSSPMIASWPCRWCKQPLARVHPIRLNTEYSEASNCVFCLNCDNGLGVTPR
ncbi:MAG: hypothetical protein QOH56_4341 [Pseudonocardiales bacterium]|jgi:hypothetical protein|nr:hypothetical protein [Pseudonocardiales bacterium]